METLPNLEDEMYRLVSEAQKQDIFLRVIGGLAIKIHSPHANHRALVREYPDIDFVTDKPGARKLGDVHYAQASARRRRFKYHLFFP